MIIASLLSVMMTWATPTQKPVRKITSAPAPYTVTVLLYEKYTKFTISQLENSTSIELLNEGRKSVLSLDAGAYNFIKNKFIPAKSSNISNCPQTIITLEISKDSPPQKVCYGSKDPVSAQWTKTVDFLAHISQFN